MMSISSVSSVDELQQFIATVTTLLREVETEIPNIRQDHERCEFYANRLLCAMWHLACIVIYMQQNSLYTGEQIQPLQDLRDNLRAIYTLIYELPVMNGYAYRPPTAQPRSRTAQISFIFGTVSMPSE